MGREHSNRPMDRVEDVVQRETVNLMDSEYRYAKQLTLRDQFAMAALAGMTNVMGYIPADVAHDAYAIADAMLAERAKK